MHLNESDSVFLIRPCFIKLSVLCQATQKACSYLQPHLSPRALKSLISIWVLWAFILWSLPTEQGHSCSPVKLSGSEAIQKLDTTKAKTRSCLAETTDEADSTLTSALPGSTTWNQIINIHSQPVATGIISVSLLDLPCWIFAFCWCPLMPVWFLSRLNI